MFGKILKFARPVPAQPVGGVTLSPDTITPDNPILADMLGGHIAELAQGEDTPPTPKKATPAGAARVFLDIVMAEAYQLYKLDDRDPPRDLQLNVLLTRYQQLREVHRWPYMDKAQLSKHLVALGCKSHRARQKGGQKMAVIVFPAYPASGWAPQQK